jgi:MFS family permease
VTAPVLHRWRSVPVLAVAVVGVAAGFGQFGAVAALGDVAETFGGPVDDGGVTIAEQAGLSGTRLGLGLAAIRLASLGSLALAGSADRIGRRRSLVGFAVGGLGLVALAALSPGFWWFVALFALSRPLLSATNAIGLVSAAEQTGAGDRASAIALVSAAYGVGAGAVAVLRGLLGDALGFRGLFALAVVPLAGVLWAGRWVQEPDRYRAAQVRAERPLPVLGALARHHRRRLLPLVGVMFGVSAVTGPANSFLFVYAESVRQLDPAVTATLVIAAGGTGLAGLLLGRWSADHLGRRMTGSLGFMGVALAAVVTYSGSGPALVAGYLTAVLAGSVFAPAMGALQSELFPTAVRGSVAGWLVVAGVLGATTGLFAFGALADVGDRFGLAAVAVFLPAGAMAALFLAVPETRGRELEEVEETPGPPPG